MSTLTISGISDELLERLRRKAAEQAQTVEQYAADMLRREAGEPKPEARPTGRPKTVGDELGWFVGSWVEDPGFDEAMEQMRRVHPDDYKLPNES